MKPGDAGLDELLNELLYVVDQDGRWHARIVRRAVICGYRCLKVAMMVALRLPWRIEQQPFPEPGCEPLAREWRRQ